jgi:hypothetical protein
LFLCFAKNNGAQNWTQLADLPSLDRDDGVGITVGNKMYFGTGNRTGLGVGADFYSLDPATDTWTTIAAMPNGAERQYAVCFGNSNYFFVYGGVNNGGITLNDLYRYDVSANTWSLMAARPGTIGVMGASGFTLGNKAYVFCGRWGTDAQLSNEVWEYDMNTNVWLQKNNFPFLSRWRGSASALNNAGYYIFGKDANDGQHREMYKYSQTLDNWNKIGDFPNPKRYYTQMQTVNNKLVIVGGIDSLNVFYGETWYFDETNGFVPGPTIPAAARKGGMSAAYQNKFYYTCGLVSTGHSKETWKLDLPVGMKEWRMEYGIWNMGPNPFGEKLYISNEKKEEINFQIRNSIGEIVMLGKTEKEIDVSTLIPGIYFLRLEAEGKFEVKKVVKE